MNEVKGDVRVAEIGSWGWALRTLMLSAVMRKTVKKWNSEVEIFAVDDVALFHVVRRR